MTDTEYKGNKTEYEGDFPQIPLDLLEYLENQYPPFIPQAGDHRDVLMVRAGAATLVQNLRVHYNAQHNINPPED